MVKNKEKTENANSRPANSPRFQIQKLVEYLKEELRTLHEEVQDLRRLEAQTGPETLLTREEAANRLSISTRTLDDMADANEIQPVRIRGRVLYHPETLEAYVERCTGGGQE